MNNSTRITTLKGIELDFTNFEAYLDETSNEETIEGCIQDIANQFSLIREQVEQGFEDTRDAKELKQMLYTMRQTEKLFKEITIYTPTKLN